jgi:hypothetical protein
MALQQACYVENGKTVGGVIPDASSAIGYKENVGGTCVNPNGYTAGSYFMASNNGYMYKALTNIARGDAFRIGTNCEQTNVSSELNSINADLTASDNLKFRFATDGEGNHGYLGADDSFIPFSSISKVTLVIGATGYIGDWGEYNMGMVTTTLVYEKDSTGSWVLTSGANPSGRNHIHGSYVDVWWDVRLVSINFE